MNFYLKGQPFAPVSGLFAAKFSAFCRKTECVLVLNAVRFGAKRKVKCCKMQCYMLRVTELKVSKLTIHRVLKAFLFDGKHVPDRARMH